MVLSITFIRPPPSSGPSLGSLHPGSRGAQMALSDFDRCIWDVGGRLPKEDTVRKVEKKHNSIIGNKYSELVQKHNILYIYNKLVFCGTNWSIIKKVWQIWKPSSKTNNRRTSHGRCWHSLSRKRKDIDCCCQLQGGAWILRQGPTPKACSHRKSLWQLINKKSRFTGTLFSGCMWFDEKIHSPSLSLSLSLYIYI